ncbi:hypothetical protein ASALC70_01093 [Alcanivorax sp. ALC70]|nr:hypothetical protein ASALC70_01093 [Alcanivorax sp. ALC70]
MRALFLAPLLILSALLVACGDTPDDGVIRDALEQELQRAHLDELFTVTEVEILEAYPRTTTTSSPWTCATPWKPARACPNTARR